MGTLRIISHEGFRFTDRNQAGRLLAQELISLKGQYAVVLGIPRGGVVIAAEISKAIDGELDIALAHKIGMPGRGELALGAVAENGTAFIDATAVRQFGISETYIQQERARQMEMLSRRAELVRRVRPKIPLKGRMVVITDDGIATGATTLAAISAIKIESPQRVIGAFPVGSELTLRAIAQQVDELICLSSPLNFAAVGQFYMHFDQVSDQEVLDILARSMAKAGQR